MILTTHLDEGSRAWQVDYAGVSCGYGARGRALHAADEASRLIRIARVFENEDSSS